jgi:amino acid transporter
MQKNQLKRNLGLVGLIATGASSMIGASIYIVPFEIQAAVPGLGNDILLSFLLAAIPALLSAFAYAILSSSMPEAGGSYIYVSRALHPFLGFIASFSQWFGLSIVMGVVAYMATPFMGDIAVHLGYTEMAEWMNAGIHRLVISMILLWFFISINIIGLKSYQFIVVLLVVITFILGGIVIIYALSNTPETFTAAVLQKTGEEIASVNARFDWNKLIAGSTILFASFIGFDAIAQAGGEAKNPTNNLPAAILITFILVSLFYLVFTYSIYRIVPWNFIEKEAIQKDVSAVSLLGYVLSAKSTIIILFGACIALLKDLPSMILSVSRFVYAWAKDGLFPKIFSSIHPTYNTPHFAILFSGSVATLGIFGCHFAADIFLGIDIMVLSMLVNFILICFAVIYLPKKIAIQEGKAQFLKNKVIRQFIAYGGIILLSFFLFIIIKNDIHTTQKAFFFHPTLVWLMVMLFSAVLYLLYRKKHFTYHTDQ